MPLYELLRIFSKRTRLLLVVISACGGIRTGDCATFNSLLSRAGLGHPGKGWIVAAFTAYRWQYGWLPDTDLTKYTWWNVYLWSSLLRVSGIFAFGIKQCPRLCNLFFLPLISIHSHASKMVLGEGTGKHQSCSYLHIFEIFFQYIFAYPCFLLHNREAAKKAVEICLPFLEKTSTKNNFRKVIALCPNSGWYYFAT